MTAAPPRTADDLAPADRLTLESWMRMWPLLGEAEARRELGLPAAPPREIGKSYANSPQPRDEVAFCKPF